MKVELEVFIDGLECTLDAEMIDYGVVIRHRGTWDDPAEIEVVEGPEFALITVTDEDGNQWNPQGEQLEEVDDILRDWWYDEVEENRL
jgi:hypothetical protein